MVQGGGSWAGATGRWAVPRVLGRLVDIDPDVAQSVREDAREVKLLRVDGRREQEWVVAHAMLSKLVSRAIKHAQLLLVLLDQVVQLRLFSLGWGQGSG